MAAGITTTGIDTVGMAADVVVAIGTDAAVTVAAGLEIGTDVLDVTAIAMVGLATDDLEMGGPGMAVAHVTAMLSAILPVAVVTEMGVATAMDALAG
jgi:hypothetical protein